MTGYRGQMPERITAARFHDADGVGDWRALTYFDGVGAYFRTGSFAAGVVLIEAIGRLADAANHHPDVDLRYPGVTVRLRTHEVDGLSDRDIALEFLASLKETKHRPRLVKERLILQREFSEMGRRWNARDFSAKWRSGLSLRNI